MHRRPTPAPSSSPLPSLDAVRAEASPAPPTTPGSPARRLGALSAAAGVAAMAGGAVYAADAPVCGTTRAEELGAHGAVAGQSLRRGDVAQTVREIGLALGWVRHAGEGTTVGPTPGILRPGESGEVTLTPPEVVTAGAPVQVDPTPPVQVEGGVHRVDPSPPTAPVRPRGGAPRRVDPSPPVAPRSPTRGGARRTEPTPRAHPLGDISSVSLHPADPTRRG